MTDNTSERIISPKQEDPVDKEIDTTMRPQKLNELIGREKEKKNFRILIEAARKRKEPVDHVLLYGPPGLGKTTFAYVIANEMGVNIRSTSGPAIERQGDLASVLTSLEPGDILFIDEIHRLPKPVEEILYPAMEDFALDIVIGKGPSARTLKLDLPRFTLMGATTRIGLLGAPLRDRFGVVQRLDFFSEKELEGIVERGGKIMEIDLGEECISEVARRSRGTARVALRLLRRVRDYLEVRGDSSGSKTAKELTGEALEMLGIDEYGLDELDRKILAAIVEKFGGGPVGITTIASAVSEEVDTISDVYEPYLLQSGFLKRTPRGRVATNKAFNHLGFDAPEGQDKLL